MQSVPFTGPTAAWAGWTLFLIQIATLVVLAVYVWQTWEIADATRESAAATSNAVRDAREARLASIAPRIVVYFDTAEIHIACVVVENVGAGTAKDVRIVFEPPLRSAKADRNSHRYFDTVKPFMPPSYRLRHVFGTWPEYVAADTPHSYQVSVSYSGVENGIDYESTFVLDIESMMDRVEVDRKEMHDLVGEVGKHGRDIVRSLGTIQETLKHLMQAERYSLKHSLAPSRLSTQLLLASWNVVKQFDADSHSVVMWQTNLPTLRHLAFLAATGAWRENAPAPVQEKLVEVLQALCVRPSFGNPHWRDRISTEMDDLALLAWHAV